MPQADLDADETGEAPEMQTQEVKYVVVERPGYANVTMYDDYCSMEFGNGLFLIIYCVAFPRSTDHTYWFHLFF